MRTGRLPAARLGLGSVFNYDLTAGRRIMYWTTMSNLTSEYTFSIVRTSHYMSAVEGAWLTKFYRDEGTSSFQWHILDFNGTNGTLSFQEHTKTAAHPQRFSILVIGTPHTTYIVD